MPTNRLLHWCVMRLIYLLKYADDIQLYTALVNHQAMSCDAPAFDISSAGFPQHTGIPVRTGIVLGFWKVVEMYWNFKMYWKYTWIVADADVAVLCSDTLLHCLKIVIWGNITMCHIQHCNMGISPCYSLRQCNNVSLHSIATWA